MNTKQPDDTRRAPAPADERALTEWLMREMPASTAISRATDRRRSLG